MQVGETVEMDKDEALKLMSTFLSHRNKGKYPTDLKFRTRYIDGMTHITCISKPV